jgi:hypothetical protein
MPFGAGRTELTTENANLHDVTARYMRLVNQPPSITFPPALVGKTRIPGRGTGILLKKNPALLAAVENIEASQYDIDVRRAAYSPKLDFRARTDNTTNYQGITGDRVNNVAELVVTWNLFNGGSDRAREKQYIERKNISLDLRETACRDTRHTLAIDYNDVVVCQQAGSSLPRFHSSKTRDAYRINTMLVSAPCSTCWIPKTNCWQRAVLRSTLIWTLFWPICVRTPGWGPCLNSSDWRNSIPRPRAKMSWRNLMHRSFAHLKRFV